MRWFIVWIVRKEKIEAVIRRRMTIKDAILKRNVEKTDAVIFMCSPVCCDPCHVFYSTVPSQSQFVSNSKLGLLQPKMEQLCSKLFL